MKASLKLLLIFIWIGLIAGSAWGQKHSPIILKRADLIRTIESPAGPVRLLDGNVWIVHDTLSITCEHTRWEETVGVLYFEDKVHFVEPHRQTWAKKAIYYEKEERAIAEGDVRIEQDSLSIFCDKAIYNDTRQEAQFFDNVRIYSLRENAVLTGNHGAYKRAEEMGSMAQQPRLVRHFAEGDSLVIIGKLIEYFFKQESSTVTDSVVIIRNDFIGNAQKLQYSNQDGKAKLTGNPVLYHKRDTLKADSIDAYFVNQKLDKVILTGNAEATSPADSLIPKPLNHMTGHEMVLSFADGQLDSVHVRGNATSIYYIREQQKRKGANRVSGDLIDIKIADGRVRWIYVEGGTEGTYFPHQLEERIQADETAVVPPPRRRP